MDFATQSVDPYTCIHTSHYVNALDTSSSPTGKQEESRSAGSGLFRNRR